MKVNIINALNNNYATEHSNKIINNKNIYQNIKDYSSNNCVYPKNYYISFQSKRKNYDEFCDYYEDVIPLTVRNYRDTQRLLRSEDEFNKMAENGFITFHLLAFEKLKDCKTVEDVKNAFPAEPMFKNLKTLDEVYMRSDSIFSQLKLLQDSGIKVFDSEDDITTFLLKKFYLECKPYKEVFEEFYNTLTPEAKEGKCGELLKGISEDRKSNAKLYRSLGIIVPDGREYSKGVRFTNPDYRINRKKYFSNLNSEETNTRIKNLLESPEAKARYSMIDAWNQCIEVREKLSEFMSECLNDSKYYNNQLTELEALTVYDVDSYKKMRNIMIAFWNKNPQYKEQLGEEIAKAIARYNQISCMGEEELKKHIEEVKKKSAEIKKAIQLNKQKNQIIKHANAIEFLSVVAKNTNVFGYKTNSSVQDFTKMLTDKMSEDELNILEGNPETEKFRELVPGGIKAKMQEIIKTPEFTNLANSLHLALLQETVNNLDDREVQQIIKKNKYSTKTMVENIVKNASKEQLDSAESKYNRFKMPLSKREISQVKEELLSNSGVKFNIVEEQYLDDLLQTQGAYSKLVLGDNKLKNFVKILILDMYDKIYGTNHTLEAIKMQDRDEIISDAIDNIGNYNLSHLSFEW